MQTCIKGSLALRVQREPVRMCRPKVIKRDACQAQGKVFRIVTCLAAIQTNITRLATVQKKVKNIQGGAVTALNHTATKFVPGLWQINTQFFMRICDGKACVNEKVVLTKQPVMEVVHTQRKNQSRSAFVESATASRKQQRDGGNTWNY